MFEFVRGTMMLLNFLTQKLEKMVRIVNYQKRQTEEGKDFFVLELQGGIEMIKSQETGQMYVTARKSSISSTFDELTCQSLIGTELPGSIEKVNCNPYEYTIRDTGEVIVLSHKFQYVEEVKPTEKLDRSTFLMEGMRENVPVGKSFSANGALTH